MWPQRMGSRMPPGLFVREHIGKYRKQLPRGEGKDCRHL
jgi:hypothetical protein